MENRSTQEALTTIENLIDSYHPMFKQHRDPVVAEFFDKLTSVINTNNVLILKTIREVSPLKFFVDDYQRGYKWQKHQVEDLLNDIHEFVVENDDFYCLQPVVVKYHAASSEGEKSCWELIDGQQRITTVYMILHYLGKEHYSIDYKTRASSRDFLENRLSETLNFDDWASYINREGNAVFDNVDNYHFYDAYKTIHKWFSDKSNIENDDAKVKWEGKLLNHTKVIWYAAQEGLASVEKQQSIDIFMRINSGKIPLTNAELIKALFLHHVSDDSNKEMALLQQSEMAQQWDAIEHGLQDKEFWGFLQNAKGKHEDETRIEILFDLISAKPNAKKKINIANQNDFYAFNHFNNLVKDNSNERKRQIVKECWNEVRQGYYRLLEWYKNDELYHLTGFLISREINSIRELWALAQGKNKSGFQAELNRIIETKVKGYFTDKETSTLSFSQLQYNSTDRKSIISILMLVNIDVHRRNKTRMSFNAFGNTAWDIEHIHAQNSKPLNDHKHADVWFEEQQKLLLSDHIPIADRTMLTKQLTTWNHSRLIDFDMSKPLYINYLAKLADVVGDFKEDDMNSLDNLCLLSDSLNRGIGNEIFSKKRQMIIQYEKEMNNVGVNYFIPISTKQVFSKYYSVEVSQMHKWSKDDRKGYRDAIVDSLSYYGSVEELK